MSEVAAESDAAAPSACIDGDDGDDGADIHSFHSKPKKQKLRFSKLKETAVIPQRQSLGAAGYDLHACENTMCEPQQRVLIKTGVAAEIPLPFYGRVAPRSGLAVKHGINVMAGVIDADYRGEILVALINHNSEVFKVTKGMRIAQLILEQCGRLEVEEVECGALSKTERQGGGFGSTGK